MSNLEPDQQISTLTASNRFIVATLATQSHESIRARNILFIATVALLLTLAGYFLWVILQTNTRPGQGGQAASPDDQRLALYNQQLAQLEDRMAGYIADSVETKLRKIEDRISSGSVGSEDIRDFEEVKSQVRQLQRYTEGKSGNLTDPAGRDHPRLQITPQSRTLVVGAIGPDNPANFKYLAYLGFASCSVMALLVGGYWWQQQYNLKKLMAISSITALLPSPDSTKE